MRLTIRLFLLGAIVTVSVGSVAGQPIQYRGPAELIPPDLGRRPVGGGIMIPADATKWQVWWEFRKDAFVRPRRSTLSTDARAELRARVLRMLSDALSETEDSNIAAACLLGLARVREPGAQRIGKLLRARLVDPSPHVRASAALALGIAGHRDSASDLAALVRGSPAGGGSPDRVAEPRTRAFAAYGLALLARGSDGLSVRTRALAALHAVLDAPDPGSTDVRVAAVGAIGLLGPAERLQTKEEQSFLHACLSVLERSDTRKLPLAQAHVPTAVAQLLGRSATADMRREFIARFREELTASPGDDAHRIRRAQSTALALGRLCTADDRETCDALRTYFRTGPDAQARNFSLISLARIGGDANREFLLSVLASGNKATQVPWAALALGVLARNLRESGHQSAAQRTTEIGSALVKQLHGVKNADTRGALAIALGLCGHAPASDGLQEQLGKYQHWDELAGYVGLALAMLGDQSALPTVRELADRSSRRPERHRNLALALGVFGTEDDADRLVAVLDDTFFEGYRVGAAVSAVAMVGGEHQVEKLDRILVNAQQPPQVRAAAASMLAYLASGDPMPWNAESAQHVNYRFAVPALLDSSGLLNLY